MGMTPPPPRLNNVKKTALFPRDGFPYGLRDFLYSALSSSCFGAYFGGNVFTETKDLLFKVDMGHFLTCIGQIRFNPVIPHLHVYFILVIQTFYLSNNS